MVLAGFLRVAVTLVAWAGLSALALADDWMVDRLRGDVFVMAEGAWLPLHRGDIVSDSSRIRSGEGSRVTFTRGAEAIELNGATEIRIFDQQGQRMTTVMQAYGTVTVEAERLQIQHFSIQTPFLAAIVKGTRFTVHSDDTQSSVDVSRGLVQVQDYVHGVATDIAPGQSAVVSDRIVLDVSGAGRHAPMVTLSGQVVNPADIRSGAGQGNNSGQGNANGIGNRPTNPGSGHGNGGGANDNGHGAGSGSGPGNGNGPGNNSGAGNGGNGTGSGHGNGSGNGSGAGNGNGSSNGGGSGNGNGSSNGGGSDNGGGPGSANDAAGGNSGGGNPGSGNSGGGNPGSGNSGVGNPGGGRPG